MANTVQSRKQKGRNLQQQVAKKILNIIKGLTELDVRSAPSGTNGSDIVLSQKAKELFPFDVECKNVERFEVWKTIEQVNKRVLDEDKEFSLDSTYPLIVFKKNHKKPYCILDLDIFMQIWKKMLSQQGDIDEK